MLLLKYRGVIENIKNGYLPFGVLHSEPFMVNANSLLSVAFSIK